MTQASAPATDELDRGVFLVAGVAGVVGVVVLGAIMSILDITVVSVAIPTFQHEFEVPAAFLLRSRPPAAADPSHEPVIHLH